MLNISRPLHSMNQMLRQLPQAGLCEEVVAAQHTGNLQPRDNLRTSEAANTKDTLEDSCWTDLPDLDLSSSSKDLHSDLFPPDAGPMAFSTLGHTSCMFGLNDTDLLSPEQLDDALFQDPSACFDNMDLESILADHDRMLGLAPDRQLQPRTLSAPKFALNDPQQRGIARLHMAAARDPKLASFDSQIFGAQVRATQSPH